MSKEIFIEKLNNRIPNPIIEDYAKKAAVFMPLIIKDKNSTEKVEDDLAKGIFNPKNFNILFEVRSSKLSSQPGDICFPGGIIGTAGKDDEENLISETAEEAAIRETCEELLTEESQIRILGASDYFYRSNMVIYPFVGLLSRYDGNFCKDEVSEVFTVPLEFFFENEPNGFIMEWKQAIPDEFPVDKINGGRNYTFRNLTETQYFWEYEGRVIWGISAKMLRSFVGICKGKY